MKKPIIAILSISLLLLLAAPVTAAFSYSPTSSGSVFILSNSTTGNSVLAYNRSPDGLLSFAGAYPTGGIGASGLTGTNQGGVVLSQDGKWLLAVNAGSNSLSVFRASQHPSTSLALTDAVSSDGTYPVSVTIFSEWFGSVVYVLNAGTSAIAANIAGFYLNSRGVLTPVPGSSQPLSGITSPAEISFNPTGTVLTVTEKSTNLIDTYTVNYHGVASGPIFTPSVGGTPFGFAFDNRGQLIVSDASTNELSSYTVSSSGSVTSIAPSPVSNGGQAAPCWVVVTANGELAFSANAHIGTISSYYVSPGGSLTLLQSTAATVGIPDLDMALSGNSHFLYAYDAGTLTIQAFLVHPDGTLSGIQTVSGIPAGADGLAAN